MTETKKKLGCFGGFAAVVAAVLVAGGAAAYWVLRGGLGRQFSPLGSAEVIPDEAVAIAYISTADRMWGKLKQFGTPEAQAVVRDEIDRWQEEFVGGTQLDFNRDLKPWIGNVAIAIVPDEIPGISSSELLAVVEIQDKLQALGFANRVKGLEGSKLEEIDYNGTKISKLVQADGTSYSIAVLGDYLAVADNLALVESSIDTFRSTSSFAELPGMTARLRQGVGLDEPLARVYVANLATLQQSSIEDGRLPTEGALPSVTSLVAGVGVTDIGLHGRVVSDFDEAVSQLQFAPPSGKLVKRFPDDTLMLVEGRDLARSWQQLLEATAATEEGRAFVAELRQGFARIGLDVDRDVFGVLDGEFAFGLIPSEKGILATLGFGGALLLETSDRKTTEATLEKLGSIVKRNVPFPLSIDSRSANGIEVTQWKLPFFSLKPETVLGYGWIANNTLAIAFGDPIVDVMVAPPELPLDRHETFVRIQQQLPQANAGYVYANVEQVMELINPLPLQAGEVVTPESLALLNSMGGIGIATSSPDVSTVVLDVTISSNVENR